MKWRNSKERELLANGGSRDQTLPNKNNPNPDLSDARNDRAPSLSPPSSPVAGVGSPGERDQFMSASPPQSQQQSQQHLDSKFHTATDANPLNTPGGDGGGGGGIGAGRAVDATAGPKELFKYEFDENRHGQIFNQFYDKLRESNGMGNYGMASGRPNLTPTNNNNNNNSMRYYDEYDSHSDTDEEISVT